ESAAVLVHMQRASHRRKRALRAVRPLANPAARADRRRRHGIGEIEPVRIDQTSRMLEIAAERDGESFAWRVIAALAVRDSARDPEISALVGHAGELGKDTVWLREGFIDVPERTGAAD